MILNADTMMDFKAKYYNAKLDILTSEDSQLTHIRINRIFVNSTDRITTLLLARGRSCMDPRTRSICLEFPGLEDWMKRLAFKAIHNYQLSENIPKINIFDETGLLVPNGKGISDVRDNSEKYTFSTLDARNVSEKRLDVGHCYTDAGRVVSMGWKHEYITVGERKTESKPLDLERLPDSYGSW